MTIPFHQKSNEYCQQIVSGKIVTNRWIKLACQRHLSDLAKQSDPAFPYRFEPAKANRICKFAELLPHVKGRWASKKQTLTLEPWQCFILCSIFGWVHKRNGLRRFRTAAIYVPRKNGKSFLSSVVGLYMLLLDGEAAPEVLCGATNLAQAEFVFRPAQQIISRTPALSDLGVTNLADELTTPDGGTMKAIIGQPPDGSSPSCALVDELHEHPNDTLLTTMQTGMGAREQPLVFITTTAGYNTAGPAKLLQDDLQDVLVGIKQHDELFGVIYSCDPGDDYASEIALIKANPNIGVSLTLDYLKSQQSEAILSPRKQTAYKTKHLNVWCNAAIGWMNLDRWNQCADAPDISKFDEQPCWPGLDLANKLDLTAYVKVFTRIIEGQTHYYLYPEFYLPEARIEDASNSHYKQWEQLGYLNATPGEVNTHSEMYEDILADARQFDMREIAHDPFGATQLVAALQAQGLTCAEVGQTWKHLSEPMKELEALVLSGRLHHTGNPVMNWCIANTVAQRDRNENIVPKKQSDEKKIDGVVATIMGVSRALLATTTAPAEFVMPFFI